MRSRKYKFPVRLSKFGPSSLANNKQIETLESMQDLLHLLGTCPAVFSQRNSRGRTVQTTHKASVHARLRHTLRRVVHFFRFLALLQVACAASRIFEYLRYHQNGIRSLALRITREVNVETLWRPGAVDLVLRDFGPLYF